MPARQSLPLLAVALVVVTAAVTPAVAGGPPDADPVDSTATPTEAALDATRQQSAAGPNLTVRSTPAAAWGNLTSPDAVARRIDAGRLPVTDRVAAGDVLVVAVDDRRLAEALGSGTATTAFFDRRQSRSLNLSVEQSNPSPQVRAKLVRLAPNTTRVLVDGGTNTTYLVVDTGRVGLTRDADVYDDGTEFDTDDEFAVTLDLAGSLTESTDPVTTRTEFRVVDRTARVRVDDERRNRLYRSPAANRTVRGVTNLAVGLNVTVLVRVADDPETDRNESTVRRVRVPVEARPDGEADDRYPTRFVATLDLADLPAGSTATVDVRYDEESLLETRPTMRVVPPRASVTVRETVPNATAGYPAVRADVSVSRGGFVVLHRGSPTGPVAGVSGYLMPGDNENATVYVGTPTNESGPLVAVVHRDAGYDHRFAGPATDTPYATNGSAVDRTDFAPTLPDVTPAPSPTPTATATEPPTVASPVPTTPPPSTTTTPGFGVVAAIGALCGAALLFRGR